MNEVAFFEACFVTLLTMVDCYSLLKILSDGRSYSGQRLGEMLGVSRTAIWKQIKALEKQGLSIFSVRGKGYRLAQPVELLDEQKIRSSLTENTSRFLSGIEILPKVDSTNRYINRLIGSGVKSGYACLAESQTEGRGRHGREWVSPFASNIYLSLYWKFESSPMALGGLSLAVGVAVARALANQGAVGIGLKWPNDLLWEKRKLGGVLLEVSGDMSGPCNVIIGIGLNINMREDSSDKIDQPWVSLSEVLKEENLDRNRVVGHILNELALVLQRYPKFGATRFLEEWRKWDVVTGKKVMLTFPGNEYSGTVLGIDDEGMLILETEDEVRKFSSGEVSLRVNP